MILVHFLFDACFILVIQDAIRNVTVECPPWPLLPLFESKFEAMQAKQSHQVSYIPKEDPMRLLNAPVLHRTLVKRTRDTPDDPSSSQCQRQASQDGTLPAL